MKPFVFLALFLILQLSSAQTVLDECSNCQPENCPIPQDCAAGLVKDKCGCCTVCARREGEKCDNLTLPLPYKHQYGFCGENLLCQLRKDLLPREYPEALCVCKDASPVCGSDGMTYSSVCKLREEATIRRTSVTVKEWAPCKSVPIITSGPEDLVGNLKDNLAFGCEAKGHPVPSLQWEHESSSGVKTKLPSDDQMIAVQVRGGPELYMVTSWVQIMELRESDTGTYTCVASNSEGEVKVSAQLDVLKARNVRDVLEKITMTPVAKKRSNKKPGGSSATKKHSSKNKDKKSRKTRPTKRD